MFVSSWLNSVYRRLATQPALRHRRGRPLPATSILYRVEKLESRVLLSAVLASAANITVVEGDPATVIDSGITVTDTTSTTLASAQVAITNYAPGQDVLGFTNDGLTMGNVAVSTNAGGVLTLTSAGGTATLAQWELALQSVTYLNTSSNPLTATRNITFSVNDGASTSNTLGSTIALTAVNSNAVLATASTITIATNAPPTAINTAITLTDVDSASEERATITITNYVAGEDVLGFSQNPATMGNIAVESNTAGVMKLTSVGGTATLAQWESAMRAVTYANTSATPSTNSRNVTFEIESGTSVSNALASTINFSGTRVGVPVLANPGSISLVENAPATAIDSGIIVADTGSATLASAQVTITDYVAGQDALGFVNNGTTMGNIAIASNAGGVLSLTSAGGTATLVQWQAALQSVTYVNTSDNPLTATRHVTFTVNDGAASSNSLGSTIALTAVNDAAVLATASVITISTNAPPTPINTAITLTDVDSATEERATVKITNAVAGEDVLGFTNNGTTMGNIAVDSNGGGVLTLTSVGGTATLAQWEAALRSVTYVNTSASPTTTARNVTFEVSSGASLSNALASTINLSGTLTGVPVLAGVGSISLVEKAAATAIDSGITVTDTASATLATAKVTISNYVAGQDVLGFTNNGTTMGNIAIATNAGGVLSLTSAGGTATLAQWQTALQSVTYQNTSSNPLTATRNVTFTVNDGTSSSNSLASTISLTAVNDGAVLASASNITIPASAVPTAINSGILLTDVDSATEEHATVTITNFMSGQDVLGFINNGTTMGNIAVTSNVGGVLTLTSVGGTATLAQWDAALRVVSYSNTSVTPNLTARNVVFEVQSGTSVSNDLASTINLTAPVGGAAFDSLFAQTDAWV